VKFCGALGEQSLFDLAAIFLVEPPREETQSATVRIS
jgi:hypothetical protein